jgi:Ca2+-binding RTX toxin-like protein
LIYDAATGALYYDPDGTGQAAQVKFALLGTSAHPTLNAGDFLVLA